MILIDSLHINNGGGLVLLKYLVQVLVKNKLNCFFLLDKRCEKEFRFLPADKVFFLDATLIKRHKFYRKNQHKFTKILCFGNIPPTYRSKAQVYTYFHNLTTVDGYLNRKLLAKTLANLKLLFTNLFLKNTDFYIVQTAYVKDIFCKKLSFAPEKVEVIPFFPDLVHYQTDAISSREEATFIFVSDGNPHKNHDRLLKAWILVNQQKPNAKLLLTISNNYPELLSKIEEAKKTGINIENLGFVSQKDLHGLYLGAKFLVYPSLMESFGLGLIEATKLGCEVIAADRSYVYAVVEPYSVFDPLEPNDIANAILTALNADNTALKTQVRVTDDVEKLVNLLK